MMNHWGLVVSDAEFHALFRYLDADGDGVLSYGDFVKKVGSELHPAEALYFRQEKVSMVHVDSCQERHCWRPTQSYAKFCKQHQQVKLDSLKKWLFNIEKTLGAKKWADLMADLRKACQEDEPTYVHLKAFKACMDKHGVRISWEREQEMYKLLYRQTANE